MVETNGQSLVETIRMIPWHKRLVFEEGPQLAVHSRFETGEQRAMNGEDLFKEIWPWTRKHDKYEVMRILGEVGVLR